MSRSLARVRAALEAAGVATEIREMAASTRSAAEAAATVGCARDQIAKSIIMQRADTGALILFLTAGGNRVAAGPAAALAGGPLARADAGVVRARTGFAIGGVAPVGHLEPVVTFLDPRLMDFATIWAAAGTPRHVFAIGPAELLRITGATPAAFAEPEATPAPDPASGPAA